MSNENRDAAAEILAQLQRKNEERMNAARMLADAIANRMQAATQLEAAKKIEEAAIRDAKKQGWTDQELSTLTGTPRKRRTRKTSSQVADYVSSPAPSDTISDPKE